MHSQRKKPVYEVSKTLAEIDESAIIKERIQEIEQKVRSKELDLTELGVYLISPNNRREHE